MRWLCAAVAALAIAGCSESAPAPASAGPAASDDPATLSTLSGTATFDGVPPAPETIRLDGDPSCVELNGGAERPTEDVVVGEHGAIQNVFVYVKDGLPARTYPVPPSPVVLDQQKCRYVPRVLGIQVGQQFVIRNGDALLHNVRAESAINEPFDVGTPVQGMEVKRTFATREVMVAMKCNVHKWMSAYIGVLDHPYFAVTDSAGHFSLPKLPPGTYTIEAWHERFGTRAQQVTVGPGETRDLTFTYQAS